MTDKRRSRRVALITGASAGIGEALARVHAERGGDLVLVARRKDKLAALAKELQDSHAASVTVIAKDLSERDAAREIYDTVNAEGIEVEFLINNAGFGGRGKFHERRWEDDLAMINVNIVALTALTRFFLADFVARDHGRILNVSSTASLLPGPLQAVYYASKAYVTYFSNALSEELSETGVTVTTLMPGATDTEFAQVSGMDQTSLFDKTVSARDVALAGYNGMLDGKLDVITGLTLAQKAKLAFVPLAPKKMILRQVRQMQEVEREK